MIDSSFIYFLNTYGSFLMFVGVVLYLLIVEKNKKKIFFVVSSALLVYVLSLALKYLFGAARPFLTNGEQVFAGYISSASFPSFHTALAFSVATSVTLFRTRTGLMLFLVAVLIGFGRVVANVHYPVDIAFGAIVGTLVPLAIVSVGLDT